MSTTEEKLEKIRQVVSSSAPYTVAGMRSQLENILYEDLFVHSGAPVNVTLEVADAHIRTWQKLRVRNAEISVVRTGDRVQVVVDGDIESFEKRVGE